MKEKYIVNLKKAWEWRKLREVILKKIIWLEKVKEKLLIKLLDKMHKYKTMLSYCLKCRKNTKFQELVMVKQWYYQIGSKKSKFIKKQEANRLLRSLGIKTPLSKIPLLSNVLFWKQFHWKQFY